jgi:hypothetical protein
MVSKLENSTIRPDLTGLWSVCITKQHPSTKAARLGAANPIGVGLKSSPIE